MSKNPSKSGSIATIRHVGGGGGGGGSERVFHDQHGCVLK